MFTQSYLSTQTRGINEEHVNRMCTQASRLIDAVDVNSIVNHMATIRYIYMTLECYIIADKRQTVLLNEAYAVIHQKLIKVFRHICYVYYEKEINMFGDADHSYSGIRSYYIALSNLISFSWFNSVEVNCHCYSFLSKIIYYFHYAKSCHYYIDDVTNELELGKFIGILRLLTDVGSRLPEAITIKNDVFKNFCDECLFWMSKQNHLLDLPEYQHVCFNKKIYKNINILVTNLKKLRMTEADDLVQTILGLRNKSVQRGVEMLLALEKSLQRYFSQIHRNLNGGDEDKFSLKSVRDNIQTIKLIQDVSKIEKPIALRSTAKKILDDWAELNSHAYEWILSRLEESYVKKNITATRKILSIIKNLIHYDRYLFFISYYDLYERFLDRVNVAIQSVMLQLKTYIVNSEYESYLEYVEIKREQLSLNEIVFLKNLFSTKIYWFLRFLYRESLVVDFKDQRDNLLTIQNKFNEAFKLKSIIQKNDLAVVYQSDIIALFSKIENQYNLLWHQGFLSFHMCITSFEFSLVAKMISSMMHCIFTACPESPCFIDQCEIQNELWIAYVDDCRNFYKSVTFFKSTSSIPQTMKRGYEQLKIVLDEQYDCDYLIPYVDAIETTTVENFNREFTEFINTIIQDVLEKPINSRYQMDKLRELEKIDYFLLSFPEQLMMKLRIVLIDAITSLQDYFKQIQICLEVEDPKRIYHGFSR